MTHIATGTVPVHLGDGRTLAPGETVARLDTKDPRNRRLIDAGRLVEQKAPAKPRKRTTKENA